MHPMLALAIELFLGFSFLLVALVLGLPLWARWLPFARRRTRGNWVAEVYLDWPICRGSTLYRQRFQSQANAARLARFHAWILDCVLPKIYWTEGWGTYNPREGLYGNRMANEYDFAICWGVRALTTSERSDFHPLWTTAMPGESGFQGEPAHAHPWSLEALDRPLAGSEHLAGWNI